MKKIKRFGLKFLALCLVIAGMLTVPVSAAGKSPQLSGKYILAVRNSGTLVLEVQNPKAKVTWTCSNPKMITFTETKGAKNQTLLFKTKGKTGVCTIQAKSGGKTYTCKVRMRKGNSSRAYKGNSGKITLEKINTTRESVWVRLRRRNCTDEEASYGVGFYVEKYVKGKWQKMKAKPDMGFPEIACVLPARTCHSEEYVLTDYYERSDFTKGKYRIYVDANNGGASKVCVPFTIE